MFIGADHEVTGSCHYVEACGKRFIVDYGMEQGLNVYENVDLPVNAGNLDFILLTHAHIDHSGLIPLLYAKGFRGKIYATRATTDLCEIMLQDSAHIQEFEAEWKNRKARRSGKPEVVPIYTMDDAINVMQYFVPCPYGRQIEVADGITIKFTDIGHLLGSSSIEVWLREADVEKKLVFSGDIGNFNQPLIKDPSYTREADYVIMESTYGERYHGKHQDYVTELTDVIQKMTPQMLSTEENKQKLEMLIRTFFNRLHGYHVQYNIVSRETLIDAQKHPEKHKDLIVRVAGYSAFFNVLSKKTQDDIIGRTEQTL